MRRYVVANQAFADKYKIVSGPRLYIVGDGPPWSIGQQFVLQTECGRTLGPVDAAQFDKVYEEDDQ